MATNKELEAQLRELQKLVGEYGIVPPTQEAVKPEDRADYIKHGSPDHAAFLGLVGVEDRKVAEEEGFLTYTSPNTKLTYRLEDQVTPYMTYPDPGQVAKLTLRQKVSSLENGKPPIPEGAPPMWRPIEVRR